MFAEIKNFITIRWDKQSIEPPPPWLKIEKKPLDKHIEIHEKLFWQLAKQIEILYPDSKLHVITNKEMENKDNIVFHKLDVPSSHLAKIEMYGLIDAPAMYIDTDVLIMSMFKKEHIETEGPFNYYSTNGFFADLQSHAIKKLPIDIKFLYNAGMVWVSKPSKKLVSDIKSLHEEFFSDKKLQEKLGFEIGDEHAATLYVNLNKMNMKLVSEINVLRNAVKDFTKCQTIHYTGYSLENKEKCLVEFYKSLAYKNTHKKVFI